ncbi:hypothetical protein [Levilactobacillus brevis]|uniref:hypothetical protein n=1 Tax=Levilactobacillus brevis TaxID=1580 RepID=UPI00040DE7F7|nr:hypothetical protein [Levilactobacillus brevis]
MLLLFTIIFCLLTYKFFTKWIWWILPIAIIYDLGLWIASHLMLPIVIVAILLGLYDKFIYQTKHGKSLFYNDPQKSKQR